MSGPPADLPLPFAVKYRAGGMGFLFGKKGGINFVKTFRQFNSADFLHDIRHLPVESYDLVINDFEPVSAWACRLRQRALRGPEPPERRAAPRRAPARRGGPRRPGRAAPLRA
ncbi:MAG: hypothetical protein WKG07_47100 [Hymenobacter sp.]